MSALFTVLFKPRTTIRRILDRGPSSRGVIFALVVAAFLSSEAKNVSVPTLRQVVERTGTAMALLVAVCIVLLTIVVSIALFYVFAWGATWAGRFVEGTGTVPEVRTALAWGFAPVIVALAYRIPVMFFRPAVLHRGDPASVIIDMSLLKTWMLIPAVLDVIVLLWYLFVAGSTLAEAQRVSSWAGLGNLLLAWILPVVAIVTVAAAAILSFK